MTSKKSSKPKTPTILPRREHHSRSCKKEWVSSIKPPRVSYGDGFFGRLKPKADKTYATLNKTFIKSIDPKHHISINKMYDLIEKAFEDISSHRMATCLTDDKKSAITPTKKTKLYRNVRALAGELNLYTDKTNTPLKKKISGKLFDTPDTTAKKVQKQLDDAASKNQHKTMTFRITEKEYHAQHKRQVILGSRRKPDQKNVMGISANEYLRDADKSSALRKKCPFLYELIDSHNIHAEWLHLICHKIKGKAGQIKNNLVNWTAEVNSAMHSIESQMPKLIKAYPDGFDLKVSASLVDDTEVGNKITYSIITHDFHLEFNFSCVLLNRPSTNVLHYFNKIFDTLLSHLSSATKTSRCSATKVLFS